MQHKILWRRWKFLVNPLLLPLIPMNSDGETCCKNTSNNSNNYLTLRSLPKLCSNAGLKNCPNEDNISSHLMQKDRTEWNIYAERNIRCLVNDPRSRARGWIQKNMKIGPVLNVRVCHHEDRLQCLKFRARSLFSRQKPPLGLEL